MSYDYQAQKANVFTEDGSVMFVKIRDQTNRLLTEAGAVRLQEAIGGSTGDSWTMLACVDRMVELGEIVELNYPDRDRPAGQHRVFVRR